MSYQVIARKWRSKTFAELVGQEHVSQTLNNALKNQRLPHALLFTGPRGTGKTSSARILAKALRCPNAKDYTPCNKCDECELIAAGNSLDVIEIDGASNNGVDAIRELRDTVGYMPSSGRKKVYIVDEVHMLTGSAFNALLKTLEEPPEHVIFIMATTEAHKIPNTILSRCQRFDFRRIPIRAIADHLKMICDSENISADDQALWMIARQGDGSMRDAQSLLDQVITFCEGEITLQKAVEVLGLTDRGLLTDTLKALVSRDKEACLDIIEKVFHSGFDPKVFAQDLLEEIRNLLFVKLNSQNPGQLVDLPDAEVTRLAELSEQLSEEDIHLLFDMTLKGNNDLTRAQDPRLVLEMLLMRMSVAPRIENLLNLNLANTTAKISSPQPATEKKTFKAKPEETKPAPQTKTEVAKPTANMSTEEKWHELVDRIKKINGVVGAKLENSYLKNLTDSSLTLAIPKKMKFLHDQVNEASFRKKLENYIQTFWQQTLSVEVELSDESTETAATPKAVAKKKKQQLDDEIRQQVEDHPLVKATKEVFKSQIKSIKERT